MVLAISPACMIFARMPSPGKCRVIAAWALILAGLRSARAALFDVFFP
jgi:hypothetical protein